MPSTVAAVIVNWNGAALLNDCLPSLLKQEYEQLEIIVVDNGSHDNSEEVVRSQPGVRWLPLGWNRGLAPALNEGARVTDSDYLLFLNNDMEFAADFVSELVTALESDPTSFAVDAQQRDWSGGDVLHSCTTLRRGSWLSMPIPGYEVSQWEPTKNTPCLYGSAANLLVRRSIFDYLGGWEDSYPAGMEDFDLALTAHAYGWRLIYAPSAECRHRVAATSRTEEGARARERAALIGHVRFTARHLPIPEALAMLTRLLAPIVIDLTQRRWARLSMRTEAFAGMLTDLRAIRKSRIAFKQASGLSARQRLRQLVAP